MSIPGIFQRASGPITEREKETEGMHRRANVSRLKQHPSNMIILRIREAKGLVGFSSREVCALQKWVTK